jgi:hypothetical protein
MKQETKRLIVICAYIAGSFLVLPWIIIFCGIATLFVACFIFDKTNLKAVSVPLILFTHFCAFILMPALVITLAIKKKLPWTGIIKPEPFDSPKGLSAG